MSIERILEILDRAHNGPVCTLKEWNTKVIPTKVSQKLKEHRLQGTYDPQNPINTDDALADELYKAGFELAVDIGFLCQDTERIVKLTGDEIKFALNNAPSEVALGEGRDRVVVKHRKPEDDYPMATRCPLGLVVSEDIWVPLMQAIIEDHNIDIFLGGSIVTVFGRPVLAGTPYETLVGRYQAQLTREVLWRAGRPGMPTWGVISATTEYGQLGGFGIKGGFDPDRSVAICLNPGELLTNYSLLHKVVQAHNCGAMVQPSAPSMIGGYTGGPEGAVLAQIANALLFTAAYQGDFCGGLVFDVRYGGNCGREAQWALSVSNQAINRNTHLLKLGLFDSVAGPCTAMLLYESAVGALNASVSGGSSALFPRTGGGKYTDWLTPLECKFCAEVAKRSAGMTRTRANEIAKVLIPRYEGMLMDPPKGKGFRECYDLRTLKPSQEWLDIYLRVKRELIDLGLLLEYP